jgi:hypothetical protein
MVRKQWLFVAPALLLLSGGGWRLMNPAPSRAADQRIADPRLGELEKKLGFHLYAPTWLPYNGRVGPGGTREGRYRVLQDFADNQDRALIILAQERRSEDRDEYHERRFISTADAKADINGRKGYFITGSSGERRLFWHTNDTAIIISSNVLTDDELVKVALGVR